MIRALRTFLAVAAAVTVAVAGAPAAPAGATPVVTAPCATGAITSYHEIAGQTRRFGFTVRIQPCAQTNAAQLPSLRFAILLYYPEGVAHRWFAYSSVTGATHLTIDDRSVVGSRRAVCLAYGAAGGRLACLGLDVPDAQGRPSVAAIPLNDSRVPALAPLYDPPRKPDPHCGTCV